MKRILVGLFILFIIININDKDDESIYSSVKYNGNNLRISVDGAGADSLPTSGNYYLVSYDCSNKNTKVTWNRNDYSLDINNGTKKSNVACYLEFKSTPLLSEMSKGSYVAYIGDSSLGCDNTNIVNGYTSCSGKNANYESDISMGYCGNSNYKFYRNGWRVAYTKNKSAYLISAGATDCMCTSSDGNSSSSYCSSYLNSNSISSHYSNMNNIALKYCNIDYVLNGVCDSTTARAMSDIDFKNITGNNLDSSSCYSASSNISCGYTNDLIDNGSYYWIYSSSNSIFNWNPKERVIKNDNSNNVFGIRPILALSPSVIVTGGDGTYESPYIIALGV